MVYYIDLIKLFNFYLKYFLINFILNEVKENVIYAVLCV
jgi:hypothetical protein